MQALESLGSGQTSQAQQQTRGRNKARARQRGPGTQWDQALGDAGAGLPILQQPASLTGPSKLTEH